MRSGGDQQTASTRVRRQLAIRADPDQVWAVATTTLHLPGWTVLSHPVPGTSPARLFLVRRYSEMKCGVSLLERRSTGAWSQDVVDLASGRVPYRIELERTRNGCKLALEVLTEGRFASARTLAEYSHRCADTWLHSVHLITQGRLPPFALDVSALDGYGPSSTSALVTSDASRRLPFAPEQIWNRLTTVNGRPSGPVLHRVRLTPGTLRVGTRTLGASLIDEQIYASLTEVTECLPNQLLTQQRLDGALPVIVSWRLQEVAGGTLLTLEHTSDRRAQQDLELALARLVQMVQAD